MAFLVKALFRWNDVPKTADISILSNFLLGNFLRIFCSTSRNFTNYYLHAKFQINQTIQTEMTGGEGRICPPSAIPICKKPGLFRVRARMIRCCVAILKALTLQPLNFVRLLSFTTLLAYFGRISVKLIYQGGCCTGF